MRTIAVIAGNTERCGMTTYTRNLLAQLDKNQEFFTVWFTSIQEVPEGLPPQTLKLTDTVIEKVGFDVAILNYHPGTLHFGIADLYELKKRARKIILIHHENEHKPIEIRPDHPFALVDAVVAHDPLELHTVSGAQCFFRMIPHGAPDINPIDFPAPEWFSDKGIPTVGSCGFNLPTKRFDVVVHAAKTIGGHAKIIAPTHPGYTPKPIGDAEVISDFLEENEVIKLLAINTMNIYYADEPGAPGQSGSARMLLAAMRPTILKRCPKTQMLEPYHQEIYFANDERHVYQLAAEIWDNVRNNRSVKIPKHVLDEHGWLATGRMYRDLIEELCHGG